MHRNTKKRQMRKFTRLTAQQTRTPMLDRSCLVINRSFRQLTPIEEEVLALGLFFAITPSWIPYEETVAATEALAHRIDQQTEDTLRLQIGVVLQNTNPPKPNLSPCQCRALMDLRKDQNIVIVLADKGRATVILNRDEYIQKVTEVIDDVSKYRILRRDPTVKTENRISDALKSLQQHGYIDDKLRDHLTPR